MLESASTSLGKLAPNPTVVYWMENPSLNATANALPRRHQITVDEHHRMGKAGIFSEDDRVELIEGEIIDMAPIGNRHASTIRKLIHLLSGIVRDHALLDVQNPIALGDRSEPEADIVLLRPRENFYSGNPPAAEDVLLLIEVADTSLTYDQAVKIPLYARYGIPEVWLVDLCGEAIKVFRQPSPEGYLEVSQHGRGQRIRPSLVPQVEVDPTEVIA